jgi:hypothetical protein
MEKETQEDGGAKNGGVKGWNSSAVAHQVMLQAVHPQCCIRTAQTVVAYRTKRIVTASVSLKHTENIIS